MEGKLICLPTFNFPALKSLFSFHLGCSYAKKKQTNKKKQQKLCWPYSRGGVTIEMLLVLVYGDQNVPCGYSTFMRITQACFQFHDKHAWHAPIMQICQSVVYN